MCKKGRGAIAPCGAMQDALRVVETSTGDFSPLETRAVKNTAAVSHLVTLTPAVIQQATQLGFHSEQEVHSPE